MCSSGTSFGALIFISNHSSFLKNTIRNIVCEVSDGIESKDFAGCKKSMFVKEEG